jgi:hypothetical protein
VGLDADTLIKHQAELATKRMNWDTWWDDIGRRVLPADAQFTTIDSEGTKRTERLFDSTAAKANRKFAAILEDLATPRTQRWHGLAAENDELSEDQATDEYFAQVTDVLFSQRYNPRAMFAVNRSKGYLHAGAFGNTAMFIDEVIGDGPRYTNCHMREIVWAEGDFGQIDTVYRKYPIAGRVALKRFGMQLSPALRSEMEKKPFNTWDFLHCTKPNEERIASRADFRGMPYSGHYVCLHDKSIVQEGGYTSFPWAIFRGHVAIGESYGRSPAMECWPSILTLGEEKKSILRAGQKEVDPPMLLSEDGVLGQFNLRPGALNYGGIAPDGSILAAPLKSGANIPLGLELMQLEKADINDAFLSSLWEMIVNENIETAAQVYELARMRAINLAPLIGRFDSEDIGPMIHRELDIAAKNGRLPELPRRLARMGAAYKVVNTSPLAKMMRAQDGLAIVRTFEVAEAAIKLDPKAANVMKVPEAFRELADINGVPPKLLRSKEEIEAISRAQAEAEQQTEQAAMAPELSQAALNAAKAREIGANLGPTGLA